MAEMFYNSGPAFVHPVTHQVVESGQWYEGAAHMEHEVAPVEEDVEEGIVDDLAEAGEPTSIDTFVCPKCGKEYKTQKNFDAHVEKCEAVPDGQPGDGGSADQ